jgi:hypothetical protein
MNPPRPILWSLCALALLAAGLSGCQADPGWECTRSSECDQGLFCRAGSCVPAVGRHDSDAAPGLNADGAPPICEEGSPPGDGELVLNEVLVDVPAGPDGDANGDGIRDAFDDEFVELVNASDHTLDITGVAIGNGSSVKFTFAATCLEPGQAAVVFGGGQPEDRPDTVVRVADSRLGYANSGGTVTVFDAAGDILTTFTYGEGPAEALTRAPQLDGPDFAPHSTLVDGKLFSPGTCPDGRPFSSGCDHDQGE